MTRDIRTPADLQALMRAQFPPSDEQFAAITAPLEPAVVVAGAGPGKTTVMAARVVHLVATGQVIEGRASWYGPGFDGRRTASGAVFDQEGWTVAHKTLPLGTILLISRGDRHVLALVNDRGPFVAGRVLDLSKGVATQLGTISAGVATVRAQVVVPA